LTAAEIVTTPPSVAFFVAMSAYFAASIFYLSSLGPVPQWVKSAARWAVIAGFVAHGVDIGWRGVEHVHPGTSIREALGFLSWIFVGAYLVLARREGLAVLGAFVAPLALVVLAAARLSPSGEPVVGLTSLGRLHIATATIGLAIFSLATLVSMIYLLQERNLKRKNFEGVLFKASASLETLDLLSRRLVAIGFPIFTVSMILGAVWVAQLQQGFNRIEWPISAITWLTYGGLVLGRTMGNLRGRRAALVTVLGFTTALVVLALYLGRRAGVL
jgi:ABC-type uncharacterized transport system permease subunit